VTDSTAFAYAGLTGNALVAQLGTDVSHRLLAFVSQRTERAGRRGL
jgi:hypothetical protein